LFKAAVKAITPRDPDAPQPQKKRSGDKKGGGLMMLVMRAAGRPAARGRYRALRRAATGACDIPQDWLHGGSKWDAFDITGLHYENGFDGEAASFDTKSDYLSPRL
jgi:hypothetical protein